MMQTGSRVGYWVVQWREDWDPSLKEFVADFPDVVIGNHVVIASCDSGQYHLGEVELAAGWQLKQGIAVSPMIAETSQLPMPGFDEWYIFKEACSPEHYENFVNTYGFSPLDQDNEQADAFWKQVEEHKPFMYSVPERP
ncbi:hypothetical protein [Noviherbaspirillum cavernae]|uniref:hypothetical protein n=1 Tax=Noviherbaspirillum cavernae TaxID=2320862 RepID=UPI001F5BEDBE|nr:hypothetical protein [Noviherbaspirillum cavernae]